MGLPGCQGNQRRSGRPGSSMVTPNTPSACGRGAGPETQACPARACAARGLDVLAGVWPRGAGPAPHCHVRTRGGTRWLWDDVMVLPLRVRVPGGSLEQLQGKGPSFAPSNSSPHLTSPRPSRSLFSHLWAKGSCPSSHGSVTGWFRLKLLLLLNPCFPGARD